MKSINSQTANSRVAFVRQSDYRQDSLKTAVESLLRLLGCTNIFANRRVLLKVNLNRGAEQDKALNTNPELVRAIVRHIRESNGIPIVADSSAVLGFTDEVFAASGMSQMAEEENVELVNLDAVAYEKRDIEGEILKFAYLPRLLREVEVCVTVPKLKIHDILIFSGAVKNQMGLLPGATKCRVHQIAPRPSDLANALVDVNLAVSFDLAIMDSVFGVEASDRPRHTGFLAASRDLVALDTLCSAGVGIDPSKVLTNHYGHRRGLGITDRKSIEVLGDLDLERVPKLRQKRFEVKRLKWPAKWLYKIRGSLLKIRVDRNRCEECGECAKLCPVSAIELEPYPVIGAECINCFACCHCCECDAMYLKCHPAAKPVFRKKSHGLPLAKLR